MNKEEVSRDFLRDIEEINKKYGLSYFVVTEGASATRNNGHDAVRNAREAHKKWERKHGYDPDHDWGNKINEIRENKNKING